jgi:hypothetical protein
MLSLFWQRPAQAQSKEKQIAPTEHRVGDTVVMTGKPPIPVSFIVTGVVRDEENVVMPGINVVRKGTAEGTVSNEFGEFNITLTNPREDEVLVFSFIGMVNMELPVSAQKNEVLTVTMRNDMAQLSGELVIAGGVVRRSFPESLWAKLKSLVTFKSKSAGKHAPLAIPAPSAKLQQMDVVVEPDRRAIVCYPNPVTDKISISLPGQVAERFISVCTLQGQVIEERISTKSEEQFDVKDLMAGIYIVKIEAVGESKWVRVVKK